MANPTTYFGWVMPNSADLVTDLPADFNVFGQGVDTSMQYLLGGTTGQVLSKTSATNMAFTWVTPTDQTPLTTKGDLFAFTTVDARLAVGTNNQTLYADSTAATGLAWGASAKSTLTTTGDILYASAANTPARLGIGTTGQTLTVASGIPSWATPASGGITQLATGSLTGASVSLTSISGSYKNLVLYLQNASLVTAGEIRFTINSLTNPYGYSYASNGALSTSGTSGAAYGYLGNFPAYQDSTSVTLTIPNYAMTSSRPHWQMFGGQYPSNGSPMAIFSWGALNNGVAVTSLQLFPASGNFNSGTYYLYGVN